MVFVSYEKFQIENLQEHKEKTNKVSQINKKNLYKKKIDELPKNVKKHVAKKIKEKKREIKKLQEIYENPKSLPGEIKIQLAKEIKEKKMELKNIYHSPKEVFTLERAGRWTIVQVVKVFLGMPVMPGK